MSWLTALPLLRRRGRDGRTQPNRQVLGLALGGGFARGIAHLGVLRVLARNEIPVDIIAGVSAGAICAAAYASGTALQDIERIGRAMRFKDVARWTVSRLGLVGSERMAAFLKRLLKSSRFEDMEIPLAIVATDLCSGLPVAFREHGDVVLPVRASCSYPGLFQPLRIAGAWYVDGAMSLEVPAPTLREMGATQVISVSLPADQTNFDPRNAFQVINRCFQIMHCRNESEWRNASDAIIEPDVRGKAWDCFVSAEELIQAGEQAAQEALPKIRAMLGRRTRPKQLPILKAPDPALGGACGPVR